MIFPEFPALGDIAGRFIPMRRQSVLLFAAKLAKIKESELSCRLRGRLGKLGKGGGSINGPVLE
jgi:hypothetical protein